VRLPRDLLLALIGVTLAGIAVFAVGSVFTAGHVTTPLRGLASAADRLGRGDYDTPMTGLSRRDELGELSNSFERMRHSIAEKQTQIMKLAYWDPLTGLPNRARFRDGISEAIGRARPGDSLAVVMLDLSRFKHVNDALGHGIGDLLLVAVGERLTHQAMRDGDLVARLSGDEFGILLQSGDPAFARSVAERIERAFETPFVLAGQQVDIGAALGLACWPLHADSGDALLNRAEVAMYAAKQRRDGPQVYDPSIEVASAQTLTLMTELRHAIDAGELRLFLQPKLELDQGRLIGAEALVRWQHPERGIVAPADFIPLAEETGLILALGDKVLETACLQLAQWATQPGMAHLTIAVNVSAQQFREPRFVERVLAVLERTGANPHRLKLELTESVLVDNVQDIIEKMAALKAEGVVFSLDDFGIGYSSLSYLKRLPLDQLKIDRSFVRDILVDSNDAVIARTIVALAQSLGLGVIAEGVETEAQRDFLAGAGCHAYQGYYFCRPLPVEGFEAFAGSFDAQPMA
jgi:diguanylate cyclase (GGDEF)-like protein